MVVTGEQLVVVALEQMVTVQTEALELQVRALMLADF